MHHRRPGAALLAAGAALALVAGCGGEPSGDPSPVTAPVTLPTELEPTTPTTAPDDAPAPPPSGPAVDQPLRVETFGVQAPLTCDGAEYTARVEWTASGAVGATVIVDGTALDEPVPVTGPVEITLACDGSAHPVLLVLAGVDGSTVVRSQAVLASPAP